jgi:hypothetical protein
MPAEQEGENIFALIATLARRASDGQLVAAAAIGVASAVLIGLVVPSWWFLALPLLCLGSFGVWGIAERTAVERTARIGPAFTGHRALMGVRVTAAVVGTLAATLALLVIVAQALGTWIS